MFQGAVSANGQECSDIGMQMLTKGGSAVDAAIAALLCEGIASLHSMGLGGGFLMTIWDSANGGEAAYLDARETAPAAAHKDMFDGNATASMFGEYIKLCTVLLHLSLTIEVGRHDLSSFLSRDFHLIVFRILQILSNQI